MAALLLRCSVLMAHVKSFETRRDRIFSMRTGLNGRSLPGSCPLRCRVLDLDEILGAAVFGCTLPFSSMCLLFFDSCLTWLCRRFASFCHNSNETSPWHTKKNMYQKKKKGKKERKTVKPNTNAKKQKKKRKKAMNVG